MTKPASKKPLWPLVVSLTIAILIIVVYGVWRHQNPTRTLRTSNHSYQLIVAQTSATQEKGLGDRAKLPADEGMLFVFPDQAVQCFWMKNMQFSLDMIWLNSNKRVEYELSNVSPKSYPKTFCPAQPAQYVIELNAGQANSADIHLGQILSF
jgi:hypothetical protein